MPTRRSAAAAVAAQEEEEEEEEEEEIPVPKSVSREPIDETLSVEDLNLPRSIVQRLAKGVLPANTQIHKDAVLAMSKSATVFVNYLTSHAAEYAARSGRKTVTPKDVFDAMHQLEFDFMLPRLEAEVTKFTAIQADKRNTYRKKVREIKKAGKEPMMSSNGYTGYSTAPVGGVEGDSPPAAKRAKLSGGEEGGDTEEEGVDEGEGDVEDEEVEDDEIEEEEEVQEGLTEDPLEEREEEKDEDEEMGEESD